MRKRLLLLIIMMMLNLSCANTNLLGEAPNINIVSYNLTNISKIGETQYKLHYAFFNGGTYFDIFLTQNKNGALIANYVEGTDYCQNCSRNKKQKKCNLSLNMEFDEAKNYLESDDFVMDLFPEDNMKNSKSKCEYYPEDKNN